MSPRQLRTKAPIDAFVWQYAFYAHLIYRKAPASHAQLSDLAQVMYCLRRKKRLVAEPLAPRHTQLRARRSLPASRASSRSASDARRSTVAVAVVFF